VWVHCGASRVRHPRHVVENSILTIPPCGRRRRGLNWGIWPRTTDEESDGLIRVMVVDDHEVVRIGLVSLLNRVPDLEVVAEAGSAGDAVAKVDELAQAGTLPHVVVMDVRMPGG